MNRGRGRGGRGSSRGRSGDGGSRGRSGEGGSRGPRRDDADSAEGADRGGRGRPPPHLRGRAIGMWYASQQRKKPAPQDDVEEMISVMLPFEIEDDLDRMLKFIEKPADRRDVGWTGCREAGNASGTAHFVDRYNHVKASDFKAKFLENLKQNARAGEDVAADDVNGGGGGVRAGDGKPNVEPAPGLEPDGRLDDRFRAESRRKENNSAEYRKMLDFRSRLPAYAIRRNILECIERNQVVVLSGETGCGKTTQVPQFILDDYIESGRGSECRILCTQPRRISAISVAERVAQERAERCGESTGFQIRLQAKLPRSRGSILYCTTGILVTKLQSDPLMSGYSHIVLDEIHERDVLSDFLLALVKDVLPLRPTLKLILMSATLNANLFSEYFDGCPMLHIPGLTFPVEEFFLEDVLKLTGLRVSSSQNNGGRGGGGGGGNPRKKAKERGDAVKYKREIVPVIKDFLRKGQYPGHVMNSLETPACESPETIQQVALETIRYICENEGEGAILVFFPGWEDISKLNRALEDDRFFKSGRFLVLPLHSLMPTVNQRHVFDRPPVGVRKIIIATNIAETSITIDDVVFVVDSGKIKMNTFDEQLNVQSLSSEWVSRANARQRKGRAGRVQPGKCYHLFSRAREATFADFPLPEMKRIRLEELCLQIKLLKLGMIGPFLSKVIEPPTPRALFLSIALLRDLNALDEAENLTPLGFHLARLPTDPQTGKMLLMAAIFSCVDPITTVTATLSFKDPFYTPLGKERYVRMSKLAFSEDSRSDHLMMVKAFQQWEAAKELGPSADRAFCREHFLSGNTLSMLRDMKKQFAGYLHEMEFLPSANPKDKRANVNSSKMGLVRAIICAGLYPNVAFARPRRNAKAPVAVRTPQDNQKVVFHSKSVLADEKDFPSPWLVYKLKQKTANVCLFDASVASPCSLLFFGQEVKAKPVPKMGKNVKVPRNQQILSADKHIKFKSSEKIAHLIQRLRVSLDDLLDFKITHPGPSNWDPNTKEGALLRAIAELLTAEAEISGLSYADDGDDFDDDDDDDDSDEDDRMNSRRYDRSDRGGEYRSGYPPRGRGGYR